MAGTKQAELRRLTAVPNITFEKGLMDTDDDTALGYVQDMNNMLVEKNSIISRDGTRVMNESDINLKYIASYTVCNVPILFGINQDNFLLAWIETWPEYDLYVCRKGFDNQKDYLSNVYLDGDGTAVNFPDGDTFISDEDDRYIYFIADTGKTIRIDKNGYFRIQDMYDDLTDQDILDNMNDARDDAFLFLGLYLTIEDATHKRLRDFYMIEDVSEKTVPIKGSVRCAYVNDAGYIGKWSDPQVLPEYKACYITTHNGLAIDSTDPSKPTIAPKFEEIVYSNDTDGLFIQRRTSTTAAWTTSIRTDITYSSSTTFAPFLTATDTTNATIVVDVENRKTEVYFDAASIDTAGLSLTATNLESWFEITDIRFLHVDTAAGAYISSGDFTTSALYTNIGDITTSVQYVDSRPMPLTYDSSSTSNEIKSLTKATLDNYGIEVDNDAIYDEYFFPFAEQLTISVDSTAVKTFYGRMGRCKIDIGDNGIGTYYLPSSAFKYANTLGSTNEGLTFKNIGNNHWYTIGDAVDLDDAVIVDVKSQSKQIVLDDESILGDADILIETACTSFMDNGKDRFAVYNDGRLLGLSQKAYRNDSSTDYETIYNKTASATDYNVPSGNLRTSYMPVCSLEMQSVKPAYNIDESVEVMTNPRDIVINGNVVYLLDGKSLWLSDKSMLLKQMIPIDFDIYAIDKFQAGAVISSSKGLYYITNKGTFTLIANGEGIIHKSSAAGGGGVYIISKKDEVWEVRMVNVNGAVYPQAQRISDIIHNTQWGAFPKMHYCDDTLWIAREEDIYGYYEGGWKKKYEYGRTITRINSIDDKLVVVTNNKFGNMLNVDNIIVDAPGAFQDNMIANSDTDTVDMYIYTPSIGGTYFYNSATLSFDSSSGGTKYERTDPLYLYQGTGTQMTVYFDTVDIAFDNNSISSNTIDFFIRGTTSLSNVSYNYTSDRNYAFNFTDGEEPTVALRAPNSTLETCSYDNPIVTFSRTRKLYIKKMSVQQHNAECIKFRVEADYTDGNDTFKITSIEILPGAYVFKYGDS